MHTLQEMQEKDASRTDRAHPLDVWITQIIFAEIYNKITVLQCITYHIQTDNATSSALFGRRKNAVQEASVW